MLRSGEAEASVACALATHVSSETAVTTAHSFVMLAQQRTHATQVGAWGQQRSHKPMSEENTLTGLFSSHPRFELADTAIFNDYDSK